MAWAEEIGYRHVGWTHRAEGSLDTLDWVVDPNDPLYVPGKEMVRRILRYLKRPEFSGGIILMHLGVNRTYDPVQDHLGELIRGAGVRAKMGYRIGAFAVSGGEVSSWDVIVVGSGFGGSVAALRLAEKGYKVLVLEKGKRYRPEDFPPTNWYFWKYLWMPRLRWFGIQQMTYLDHVMVLSGVGVGGGSLVYANTLLVPPREVLDSPGFSLLGGYEGLMPYYERAQKMLGVTECPVQGEVEERIYELAREIGREHTFHRASS